MVSLSGRCRARAWEAPRFIPVTGLLSGDLEVTVFFLGRCQVGRMCPSRPAWDSSSCSHGCAWGQGQGKGPLV